MRKSLFRDESGMAMVLVIMVMLVVTLLSTAALSMASSNVKNSLEEREYQSTYYIAEAGANIYMETIKFNIKKAYNDAPANTSDAFFAEFESLSSAQTYNTASFFEDQPNALNPKAVASLELIDSSVTDQRTYLVKSTGETDNLNRLVSKRIVIKWEEGMDLTGLLSVYSKDNMNINGGEINGPIGSETGININSDSNPSIDDYHLSSGDLGGTLEDWWKTSSNVGSKQSLTVKNYELPAFPPYPDLTGITAAGDIDNESSRVHLELNLTGPVSYVSNIRLANSSYLTINVGDEDRELVIDDLNIIQGHIILNGTGNLKIYVRNNCGIGGTGDSIINHPDPPANYKNTAAVNNEMMKSTAKYASNDDKNEASKKLTVYYSGPNEVKIDNNLFVYANLFINNADFNFNNSGESYGSLILGGTNIKIAGAANINTPLLYAPNSNITLEQGTINGPVISKKFDLNGNGKVNYTFVPDAPDVPGLPTGDPDKFLRSENAVIEN